MIKKFLAVSLAVIVIGTLLVAGAGWAYLERLKSDLPKHTELKDYAPPIMTRIHAGDGNLIGEYANERRIFVPIEAIPPRIIYAFISAEDKAFFEHEGVDWRGVLRAAVANVQNVIKNRRLEGASTITQQVAKNFFLTNEVSLKRKIKEALLARRIEKSLTKAEILELYLNEIYLGMGTYGVASASLHYFDKALNEITDSEAAYLAALPKAPNNYRPDDPASRARGVARRNWVLERMQINGYLSMAQAAAAQQEPLTIRRHERKAAQVDEAAYFVEEVRRTIVSQFDERALYTGGLSVRTSLNMDLQHLATKVLRQGLVDYDQRHGWRGPVDHFETLDEWRARLDALPLPKDITGWAPAVVLSTERNYATVGVRDGVTGIIPFSEMEWARAYKTLNSLGPQVTRVSEVLQPGDVVWVEQLAPQTEQDVAAPVASTVQYALRQVPAADGALVALDPHTGRVLAMSGGFSFGASEFNRAVQAWRQPGSAFKPFVYAAALDNGYTPATLVLDAPFVAQQGPGLPLWRPENYTRQFYGPSTLRLGIEKSRNLMTVRLAQDLGMATVAKYAENMGVVNDLPELLSMALGAGETTVLRLTSAYAMFVNGGHKITPSLIDRIQNRYGATIEKTDIRECPGCVEAAWQGEPPPELPEAREQVLDPRTAYQITSMLEGVVLRGTGRTVAKVGKPLGGKTGTTNDERDAWFVGFAPDLAVGVYVGFDSNASLGHGETGGRAAAPIFREFMMGAIGDQPSTPFRRPPGLAFVRIDVHSGRLARASDPGAILEAFRPGTEPTPYDSRARIIGDSDELWNDLSSSDVEALDYAHMLDETVGDDYGNEIDRAIIMSGRSGPQRERPVQDGSGGLY